MHACMPHLDFVFDFVIYNKAIIFLGSYPINFYVLIFIYLFQIKIFSIFKLF